MKGKWLWTVLCGVVLGVFAGFFLGLWLLAPLPEPKQGLVLEAFDFQKAAAKAGNSSWRVVHDGAPVQSGDWYYLGPWQGKSLALTRQILARKVMSEQEAKEFAGRFQTALKEAVESQGARTSVSGWGSALAGEPKGHLLEWSGYHYFLGGMSGVVETIMVGDGERITLVVTFTEVRATAESWQLGDMPLFRRSSGKP